jgi:hypothetical protein
MAIKQASSAVEHPATQMRIGTFPAALSLAIIGNSLLFKVSNAEASRKKLVTLINTSWYSVDVTYS